MRSYSDKLEYSYKGTRIEFLLQTLILDKHVSNKVIFDYKNIRVDMFYIEEQDNCYSIIDKICKIIDQLGEEGFCRFNEYYHKYHSLQKHNIIIDNKIYNYFHSIPATSGQLKYHFMRIDMEDGTTIDNQPLMNQDFRRSSFDKDVYNKNKSFENLKNKTLDYNKKFKVCPKDNYLDEEKTNKLNEILTWSTENEVIL